jgi:hypothetical protein
MQAKLLEAATLEVNCKIGKDRHFFAASRKDWWKIRLGLVAVVGTALISSSLGAALRKVLAMHIPNDYINLLAAGAPVFVGICTATVGFLGLEKQAAQHKFIGNAYVEVERKVRSLINSAIPGQPLTEDWIKDLNVLVERYLAVNTEGEACPTSEVDGKRAIENNRKRHKALKEKIREYDIEVLGVQDPQTKFELRVRTALWRGIRFRMACMFRKLGLVRKNDFASIIRSLR